MVQSCVSDPFSFSHKIISVSFFLTDVQKCNIAVNFTFSFVNQFLQPFEYSRYHTDIPSLPLSSSLPLPSVLSKQCTFDSKNLRSSIFGFFPVSISYGVFPLDFLQGSDFANSWLCLLPQLKNSEIGQNINRYLAYLKVLIFPFRNSILFWVLRNGQASGNAFFFMNVIKIHINILSSIVKLNTFYPFICLVFQ